MNLQPTDILIRQSGGKETLWLSQRMIVEVCEVSDYYLWKKARPEYKKSVRSCDLVKCKEFLPDSGRAWRWGKPNTDFTIVMIIFQIERDQSTARSLEAKKSLKIV